jgi:hypothetical protein
MFSIVFIFVIFSNSLIKAASMIGHSYTITEMTLTQSDTSVKPKSASFKVESVMDNSLGNVEAQSKTYSTEVVDEVFETIVSASTNLENAHVYPNPCKVYAGETAITFTYLTSDAVIKIYTISGDLVKTINKSNFTNKTIWDLKNNSGENVASGIYVYFIKYRAMIKKGKIVVIR